MINIKFVNEMFYILFSSSVLEAPCMAPLSSDQPVGVTAPPPDAWALEFEQGKHREGWGGGLTASTSDVARKPERILLKLQDEEGLSKHDTKSMNMKQQMFTSDSTNIENVCRGSWAGSPPTISKTSMATPSEIRQRRGWSVTSIHKESSQKRS